MVKGGQSNQKVTGGTRKNVSGGLLGVQLISDDRKCKMGIEKDTKKCDKIALEKRKKERNLLLENKKKALESKAKAELDQREADDQLPRVLVHCMEDPSKSLHDQSRLDRKPEQPAGFYMSKYFESMAEIGKTEREEENYKLLAGENTGDNTEKAKAKQESNGESPVLIEKKDPRCKDLLENRYSEFYCALFTNQQYEELFKKNGDDVVKVFGPKDLAKESKPTVDPKTQDTANQQPFFSKPQDNAYLVRDFADAFGNPCKESPYEDEIGYEGKKGKKAWRYLYTKSITGNESFQKLCVDKDDRSCVGDFKEGKKDPVVGKIFLQDENYFPKDGNKGDRGPGHLISLKNDGTADMGSMGRGDFVQHSLKKLIVYLIAIASRQTGAGAKTWSKSISSALSGNRLKLKLPNVTPFFDAVEKMAEAEAEMEDDHFIVEDELKDKLKLFYSPLTPRVDKHVAITKEMKDVITNGAHANRLPNAVSDDKTSAFSKVLGDDEALKCLQEPPNTMFGCGIFVPSFTIQDNKGKDQIVQLKDNNGSAISNQDDALKECIFVGYDVDPIIMQDILNGWLQTKGGQTIKKILGDKLDEMGFTVPCPPSMVMKGIDPLPLLDGNGDNPDFISDGSEKKLGTMMEKITGKSAATKKKEQEENLFSNVLTETGFNKLYKENIIKELAEKDKKEQAHRRTEYKDFREKVWLLKNGKCYGEFTGKQKIPYSWDSEDLCFHFTDAPPGNWITAGWSNQEKFFDTAQEKYNKFSMSPQEAAEANKNKENIDKKIEQGVEQAPTPTEQEQHALDNHNAGVTEEVEYNERGEEETKTLIGEASVKDTTGGKKTRKRNNKTRKRKTHKKKGKKLRRKRR